MINETTQHLGLQLPHPTNSLEDDVLRLRSAFNAIDAKFQALDAMLASDDVSLNTIQELVDAIKADALDLLDHVGSGGTVHAAATTTEAGFMSALDKTALDGHLGAGDTAHAVATDTAAGFMSATDKTALDGHLGAGGTAHAEATDTTAGFMSAADKGALDGHLGAGGEAHAAATETTAGFMSATDKAALDGHLGAGGAEHAEATATVAGFMPAADKEKLDGVALAALFDSVVASVAADGDTSLAVTGGYTAGSVMVFKNREKMLPSEFTATDGTSITLTTGALAADQFEVVRFKRALAA